MPPEHGRRLADLLVQGRLVEIEDSYTLIPLDQPAQLARLIQEFTHTSDTSDTSEMAERLPEPPAP
ncbi:alpha/beta fold hydrolase [Streptomyces sp. 900105755]